MKVDYFQIWLDHRTAEELVSEKERAERDRGLQATGYHVDVDITGETVEDFFRNLITEPVEIGYSGVSDTGELDIPENVRDEIEALEDFEDQEVEYQETEITKSVRSAVPVPNVPPNYNPGWMVWAQDQLEQDGFETEFYIEGEGQAAELTETLEETGYNMEMGIEINGEERYSLSELNEVLY